MDYQRFSTLVLLFVSGDLSEDEHQELMDACRFSRWQHALLCFLRSGSFPAGMAA